MLYLGFLLRACFGIILNVSAGPGECEVKSR